MKKRGQFFLIASIVIVGILLSLGVVYNIVIAPEEDIQVYDLSEEIDFEASKVIDTGIFYGESTLEISQKVGTLNDAYSISNKDKNFMMVYGNREGANIIKYDNVGRGRVGIKTGSENIKLIISEPKKLKLKRPVYTANIRVLVEEIPYTFELSNSQNFYVVIVKEDEQ